VLSSNQHQISEISNFESFAPLQKTKTQKDQAHKRVLMDSRSAYQPLENNMQLETISRPSSGSQTVKSSRLQKQSDVEFRAVETIEEFFRPALVKQNDETNSQILNTELEGESYMHDTAQNPTIQYDQTGASMRKGFPDMSYLNPDKVGAPFQAQ
jgi:hypothetical protein